MSTGSRATHSAASSTLGYFYQCRYALVEALRRLPDENAISVAIETLDDVVFEAAGSPIDLLQTKHHTSATGNLSDASPDLWKTLRIWIVRLTDSTFPRDAQFFLITTAACTEGSAAAYLRPRNRDPAKALERFAATASTSTSATNRLAYRAFNSLSLDQRKHLVTAITVFDRSPPIGELLRELRIAVFHAAARRFLDSYVQRLEGWWYARVVEQLQHAKPAPILGEELEAESNRIREQFKRDSLPIDDDIMSATLDATGYQDRLFVEQLKLINVNPNRVVHAIRNYYRAFEQRSRWIREDLLHVGDLDRYEARLIEEWDLMFQQMTDRLGDEAAEEALLHAARDLYNWVELGAHLPVRTAVTEPSIARGTYQILADDLRVGWHKEFRLRLQHLLTQENPSC